MEAIPVEKVRYLTELEVSKLTGFALSTLRNHRHRGVGLPYLKLGRAIRYKFSDIVEFMDGHKIETIDSKRAV